MPGCKFLCGLEQIESNMAHAFSYIGLEPNLEEISAEHDLNHIARLGGRMLLNTSSFSSRFFFYLFLDGFQLR